MEDQYLCCSRWDALQSTALRPCEEAMWWELLIGKHSCRRSEVSREVLVSKYEVERDPTIMSPVASQNRAGSFHSSLPTALENSKDEIRDWYSKLCSNRQRGNAETSWSVDSHVQGWHDYIIIVSLTQESQSGIIAPRNSCLQLIFKTPHTENKTHDMNSLVIGCNKLSTTRQWTFL